MKYFANAYLQFPCSQVYFVPFIITHGNISFVNSPRGSSFGVGVQTEYLCTVVVVPLDILPHRELLGFYC